MAAILKFSKFILFILTSDMERSSEIIPQKVFLMLITSLMTSRWWRQSWPSIFMFEWNCHIFRDTGRIFEPIITKLGLYMKPGTAHRLVDLLGQRSNNTVMKSKVGHILKLPYPRNIWARTSIKSSKCREFDWLSIRYTQLSFGHQIRKDGWKLCQKKYFWCCWRNWWRHSVTSNLTFYIHV